jgi:hypothetical protein
LSAQRFYRPIVGVAIGSLACGVDVNLGGTADGGAPDALGDTAVPVDAGYSEGAPPLRRQCDPCNSSAECAAGFACGQFAGDTYCGGQCDGGGCAPSDTCETITMASLERASLCVPKDFTCAPATTPTAKDGGALTQCGDLVGPMVDAGCHSCGKYTDDCQPNGCYGGWWCNTYQRDCQRPPESCP